MGVFLISECRYLSFVGVFLISECRYLSFGCVSLIINRATDARIVLDEMFKNPIIDASKVSEIIGKSNVSSYKLITDMEDLGILEEITGSKRDRIYVFKDYIALFK